MKTPAKAPGSLSAERAPCAIAARQRGFGLLQMVLTMALLATALGLGIRFALDLQRQTLAVQQARKLYEVHAAMQRFINDLRPALIFDFSSYSDCPMPNIPIQAPFIDADHDGADDQLKFNCTVNSGLAPVFTLTAAPNMGNTLKVAGSRAGAWPSPRSVVWDLDSDTLQASYAQWLKPGPLITLDLATPFSGAEVVAKLGVLSVAGTGAAGRQIRGLACLAQPIQKRDGKIDTDLLQAMLRYQPRPDSGLGQAQIAVAMDGLSDPAPLISSIGRIDLTDEALMPATLAVTSPTGVGLARAGTVCVLVGDWPQNVTVGVSTPSVVDSATLTAAINSTTPTPACDAPGRLQVITATNGTVTQAVALQGCGSNLTTQAPPKEGGTCSTEGSFSLWGQSNTGTNVFQIPLRCVKLDNGTFQWRRITVVPTAKIGDTCDTTTIKALYTTIDGVVLSCTSGQWAAATTLPGSGIFLIPQVDKPCTDIADANRIYRSGGWLIGCDRNGAPFRQLIY